MLNENKRNLILFSVIMLSLAITVFAHNLTNPLFRLKLQLTLNSLLKTKTPAQLTTRETPAMAINILPTNQPTTIISPSIAPTEGLSLSPMLNPTPTKKPTPTPKQPTAIPTPSPTTKPVFKAVAKNVYAYTDPLTKEVTIRIEKDMKYVERTYTLTNGQQVKVIVPIKK